jgi:DNA processing protein
MPLMGNESMGQDTRAAAHWLRLAMVRGVGPLLGRKLVQAVGSIDGLWASSARELAEIEGVGPQLLDTLRQSAPDSAEATMGYCRLHDIQLICPDDSAWPETLSVIEDAPLVLFVRGDVAHLNHRRMLAIVGARKASREGRLITRRWSKYFSDRGIAVVSGMAYGIDAAAHGGTLEGLSPTLAVLGCGLACLSEEQQRQVEAISRQGCVISEFFPEVSARPEYFPRRNRIIAALTQATLVMEADLRSGSLITARQAVEYGRDVLAVPGSVLASNHAGCHQLIRDGAGLAESAACVLQHMDWLAKSVAGKTYTPNSSEETLILQLLNRETLHVDALAETCGLTVPELSPILLRFELQGVVERLPGSRYLLAVEFRDT